ncbi:MAG: hypothetical protein JNG88_13190 [Phycisphaerales bacterium]|nr:hypothetical protein [Phycisphaerales bacterium]
MLLRERSAETIELHASLSQLKKLYRALFAQLHAGGGLNIDDLDEDDMLLTLQTYLQKRATAAGVDCTDHSAWEAFLGITSAPSCETRFASRNRQTGS